MPAPRRDHGPGADRPHPGRPRRPARRAAEPLAWWTVLLAVYLGLVSTISITETTVGALAAAAGAAAAVAGRRALLTGTPHRPGPRPGTRHGPRHGRGPSGVRLAAAMARLPGQVAADTARITVRGASGGDWTPLPVAPGPTARGTATLLMSVAPGTYAGGVDPGRGLLRVHRLVAAPSPFERGLRAAGLVGGPGEAP
ncbi:hypothetical protein ABZ806_32285 [Spirillospora sp. NPDC047418]